MTRAVKIKKYYLVFAFCAVSIIALLYGISPYWFARRFLGVPELDPNLAHILRAVMGLYLGLGLFWLFAAFSGAYRNAALLTTVIFCGGLVTGRLISLFADGRPSALLILFVFMEFAIAPLGYWIFRLPE
jgi:Domain of unknown function (DUF4345)